MRTSPTPLAEKMTLFWHSHFACGFEKVQDMSAMQDQHTIFRQYGMGDFGELLRRVSISSAMLVYIDNESNVAGGIQENFARELMELHTIGVGNFTEADVVAMARAWTGHNVVGWNGSWYDTTYHYYANRHDNGQKTLFGITDNWDATGQYGGRSTINELVYGVKQADTARFIARKLFKFFVNISPTDTTVQNLANVFVGAGMNIAALVRANPLRFRAGIPERSAVGGRAPDDAGHSKQVYVAQIRVATRSARILRRAQARTVSRSARHAAAAVGTVG